MLGFMAVIFYESHRDGAFACSLVLFFCSWAFVMRARTGTCTSWRVPDMCEPIVFSDVSFVHIAKLVDEMSNRERTHARVVGKAYAPFGHETCAQWRVFNCRGTLQSTRRTDAVYFNLGDVPRPQRVPDLIRTRRPNIQHFPLKAGPLDC